MSATATRLRVMEPGRPIALREVWEYRDLLSFLTWRDVKVRYTQSLLGVGWAVGQPLLMMVVFAVFLGSLARVPSPHGVPYAPFVLSGLVPWVFFGNAVTSASQSLVGSANLVEKVYFPRLVVPAAAVAAWVPDLLVATGLLVVTMLGYGLVPGWSALALPLFAALALLAAASIGVWVSALNVAYRDVKYAVPFLLQLGMFATPVVYPATLVPAHLRAWYALNPMVGVVEGTRWALFSTTPPSWPMVAASGLVLVALLVSGLAYFRRVERYFADVI